MPVGIAQIESGDVQQVTGQLLPKGPIKAVGRSQPIQNRRIGNLLLSRHDVHQIARRHVEDDEVNDHDTQNGGNGLEQAAAHHVGQPARAIPGPDYCSIHMSFQLSYCTSGRAVTL